MSEERKGAEAPARFEGETAPTFRCPSCGAPAAAHARACVHCGSLLATRRCLACFQLSPREAERCVRCGALLPQERLEATAPGPCPDCRMEMVAQSFGAVGYAECPRCSGLFLTRESFDAVQKDADTRTKVRLAEPPLERKPGEALGPVRYRPCPACRRLMNRLNFAGGSGIVIDACRDHGFWFDRGELAAIVAFLENGGWEKVKKRERERLEEEVRSLERAKEFQRSIELPASRADQELRGLGTLLDVAGFLGGLFHK